MGQIDLGTLPPYSMPDARGGQALPSTGMLFFFCQFEGKPLTPAQQKLSDALPQLESMRSVTRVLYAEAPGPDRPVPDDLLASDYLPGKAFAVVPLRPYWIATSNGYHDPTMFDAIVAATGEPAPVFALGDKIDPHQSYYVYDGRPDFSNLSMFLSRVYGGGPHEGVDETPLLLMSFYDGNFLIDIPGMMEFWILPSDLRARRFDKAWAIMGN